MIVGALAVAAVWNVVSHGPFDRLQMPVVPGGAQTGPTVIMGSFYPEQVGASVLPPEGASPSAPERGKLVAGKEDIYVYADGRMIWVERVCPSGSSNASHLRASSSCVRVRYGSMVSPWTPGPPCRKACWSPG